jgi:hypothetical protein
LKEESQIESRAFTEMLYKELMNLVDARENGDDEIDSSSEESESSSSSDELPLVPAPVPAPVRATRATPKKQQPAAISPKSTTKKQAPKASPNSANKKQSSPNVPSKKKSPSKAAPTTSKKSFSAPVVDDTPRKSKRLSDQPIANSPLVPKKFKPNSLASSALLILFILRIVFLFV